MNGKLHKMDDWKRFCQDFYRQIIERSQTGTLLDKMIAGRIYDNKDGIYETPKSYHNGFARNDGSWLIYNTCRMARENDVATYKDKVFCKDKKQVIEDLYSYILFLRKIGIEVLYEMRFYAVSFLNKYLRFYDKTFDCNKENQDIIMNLCRSAFNKEPEDIEGDTRIDKRRYALDPDYIKGMTTGEKTRFQKNVQKTMTDEWIRELYNPRLTNAENLKGFREHGLLIKERRLQEWKKENRGALWISKPQNQ